MALADWAPTPGHIARRSVTIAVAPTLLLLSALATAAPVRHAVVVGAHGGGNGSRLDTAERDAGALADLLVELGDFDSELVTVLYTPSLEALGATLAWHRTVSEQSDDDLFLLYFAGQADALGLSLAGQRYRYDALTQDLDRQQAETQIGVLDLSWKTGAARDRGAGLAETLIGQARTDRAEFWLIGSAPTDSTWESENHRSSHFAHSLRSAMRGAADTDDAAVDLGELHHYTLDRAVAGTGDAAAASRLVHFARRSVSEAPVVLTDVRNASAILTLAEDISGQVSIHPLPDRHAIVELRKPPGRALHLALPAGSHRVRRETNTGRYEAVVELVVNERSTIDDWGDAFTGAWEEEARLQRFMVDGEPYPSWSQPNPSPAVAATASLVAPGAGQLYNGQFSKGLAYFVATSALLAGAITDPVKAIDPYGTALFGGALWGASVADAIYQVQGRERRRPIGGAQVSFEGAFGVDHWRWSRHFGLSADVVLLQGAATDGVASLSMGLDRVGYTPYRDGWDAHAGSRVMVGWEGRRWRPAVLTAVGLRRGDLPSGTTRITRSVFGFGGNLRYYFVPRYFTSIEARWERDGDQNGMRSGVGLGTHLGR